MQEWLKSTKFLNQEISFNDIPTIIEDCLSCHSFIEFPTLDEIDEISDWTKEYLNKKVSNV